ncbi:MAG TPA: hypothetical protein DCZ95_02045 [Verrucomicrobia bacterium]|nr:MAG: hypothetical protein A2X46_00805 [Lentisphaerae bacterium GWF2_57_35]HBA82852.1 hypothetical protein [Verrucomicrobiota bacterium]
MQKQQCLIGHELHDGLGQHLTGIEFSAKVLEGKLSAKRLPEARDAAKLTHLINQSIVQACQLSRLLAPVESGEEGFRNALQGLSKYLTKEVGVSCELNYESACADLRDHFVATHLFRIVQESTTNAIKHGQATRIEIAVREEDHRLVVSVKDNGTGLSQGWENASGIGLRLMRHRAQMIDADLQIQPAPEGGVWVQCTLSVQKDGLPRHGVGA